MIRFMFHALNAVPTNEHNDVFCFSDVFFFGNWAPDFVEVS